LLIVVLLKNKISGFLPTPVILLWDVHHRGWLQ
jgi:hypothetical protein